MICDQDVARFTVETDLLFAANGILGRLDDESKVDGKALVALGGAAG